MRVSSLHHIVTVIAIRAYLHTYCGFVQDPGPGAQDASTIIFSRATKHRIFIRRRRIIVYSSTAKFTPVLYQGCGDYYDNQGKAKRKKKINKNSHKRNDVLREISDFVRVKKYLFHLLNLCFYS